MFCVPVDVPSMREAEAGSEAGSIEQGCLLTRFRLMFSGLSHTAQAYLPKDDTTSAVWVLLNPSTITKLPPQTCPHANLMEALLQLRFPLPSVSSWQLRSVVTYINADSMQ